MGRPGSSCWLVVLAAFPLCVGLGATRVWSADVLGIFFDAGGTARETVTTSPYQSVTAYLVLIEPSASEGVGGWECVCDAVGPGLVFGSWTLSGNGVNMNTPPLFQVGIGTGPAALPWSPAVTLATHTAIVSSPDSAVSYYLHPYEPASLPGGTPVYADGGPSGELRPLHPLTTCEMEPAATINAAAGWPGPRPEIETSGLDFGLPLPGEVLERGFVVRNTTPALFVGTIRVTGIGYTLRFAGSESAGDIAIRLRPGEVRGGLVTFCAPADGDYHGAVTLSSCGAVFATAPCHALAGTPACAVSPTLLDFGVVPVGSTADLSFTVSNPGTAPLLAGLSQTFHPAWTIVNRSPTGWFELQPGESQTYVVRFSPPSPGERYTGYCSVGSLRPSIDVPISLLGQSTGGCLLEPAVLDFGDVVVGSYAQRSFTITNTGGGLLNGTLTRRWYCFYLDAGSGPDYDFSIAKSRTFTVTYSCRDYGPISGTLYMERGICEDLDCHGVGVAPPPPHDLMGIWFGSDRTASTITTTSPNQIVTATLGLVGPSALAGVFGWRACVGVEGPAEIVSWELAGEAVNAAMPPCFDVTLASPLSQAPSVRLATLELLVRDPTRTVGLYVRPLTAADSLAYTTGGDTPQSVAVLPVYASFATPVAVANPPDATVDVSVPAPVVTCATGSVTLTWHTGDQRADAAHVWRRIGGGSPSRLTAAPWPLAEGGLLFVDPATGLPNGARLSYWLDLLRDGTVVAQTPEIGITLTGAPPVVTAMLGNCPNPFNPLTRVRFTLARADRALVEVFEASGRRVRVLADAVFPEGENEVAWDGRDDAGRLLPSGVYFSRLTADEKSSLSKMMLLR